MRVPRSHGSGDTSAPDFRERLRACGNDVIIEAGALVFHPENVSLGARVYVGHHAILKGYYKNELDVGDGSWIGQAAFLHAAGGIVVGREVGIGPHACIITSVHEDSPGHAAARRPIMDAPLRFAKVVLGDGCDVGVGAIILPGVTVGEGAQVGAGSVVTRDVPPYAVVAGNPARLLRSR